MDEPMEAVNSLYSDHSRIFAMGGLRFESVYPVLSRRARGLSVGINLNLDKGCNFDCIYCQVDRTGAFLAASLAEESDRELSRSVVRELGLLFDSISEGRFFGTPPFDRLPPEFQTVRDIAFSGDGEPTLAASFRDVTGAVRQFISERAWGSVDPPLLRLITNGTGLFGREMRSFVREVFLPEGGGEIWLKLDCGDQEHFERINRANLPFERMMGGIEAIVFDLPVTIQTMVLDDERPPSKGGFVSDRTFWSPLRDRIIDWSNRGALIAAWHLYTVARPPAVEGVVKVPFERIESWAQEIRPILPFPVLVFR